RQAACACMPDMLCCRAQAKSLRHNGERYCLHRHTAYRRGKFVREWATLSITDYAAGCRFA
ncbi:MAG: hypothetical protein ACRCXW_09700, partial [Plesiomonas shigelloides]